ncbi:hypothetical protein KIN20_017981 [Parelaphostrongylus tenuis]|uniref:Uncharacterized protein n=1 Tax=Parelaphostrongylus tenuis TaxID=148309 RepID=A0AAD5QU38_PARTN|nr:hypothetical protein KIN20_017981 [Parelaphostrongylus tenuis]
MLSWNIDYFLSQSERFDTITSACIVDDSIAIGTYSGKILFYSSNCDLANDEIVSMTKIHAPIVSVKSAGLVSHGRGIEASTTSVSQNTSKRCAIHATTH